MQDGRTRCVSRGGQHVRGVMIRTGQHQQLRIRDFLCRPPRPWEEVPRRVVVTAAHCIIVRRDIVGESPADIRFTFNPDGDSPVGRLEVAGWATHPLAAPLDRYSHIYDVGVLFLRDSVSRSAYSLPGPGVLGAMARGTIFALVGYGARINTQGTGKPTPVWDDQRRAVTAPLQALTQTFLKLQENTVVTDLGGDAVKRHARERPTTFTLLIPDAEGRARRLDAGAGRAAARTQRLRRDRWTSSHCSSERVVESSHSHYVSAAVWATR
jgi:hypothetical protein